MQNKWWETYSGGERRYSQELCQLANNQRRLEELPEGERQRRA
jgi:hypothetical protein